jgi:hypothetical protein
MVQIFKLAIYLFLIILKKMISGALKIWYHWTYTVHVEYSNDDNY